MVLLAGFEPATNPTNFFCIAPLTPSTVRFAVAVGTIFSKKLTFFFDLFRILSHFLGSFSLWLAQTGMDCEDFQCAGSMRRGTT